MKSVFRSAFLFILLATLPAIQSNYVSASAQPGSPANNSTSQALSESVQKGLVNASANLLEAFLAADSHIRALEADVNAQKAVNAALQGKITLLEAALQARALEAENWKAAFEAQRTATAKLEEITKLQGDRITKLEKSNSRRGKAAMALGIIGFVAGIVLK